MTDPNRDYQSVRMTADFARTFAGERRIVLRPPPGSRATELTLILRSDPSNGIGNIEGLPFTGIRTGSSFEVRFDFLAAMSDETRVFWRLRAAGDADPGRCFAAATGSLTNRSGVGRFRLTAREVEGCVGSRFSLDIAPERYGSGFFDHPPYSKTVTFELVPLSARELDIRR